MLFTVLFSRRNKLIGELSRTQLVLSGMFIFLAFATWSNVFQFHFGSPVHRHEFFHYYLGSKYLPELQYNNLYRCVLVAQSEVAPSTSGIDAIPDRVRDLRTNKLMSSTSALEHPEECKWRFSPERWQDFKTDLNWFWHSLTAADYAKALGDHGFNATPVWSILGSMLARLSPASSFQIYSLGMLDLLLLSAVWLERGRSKHRAQDAPDRGRIKIVIAKSLGIIGRCQ